MTHFRLNWWLDFLQMTHFSCEDYWTDECEFPLLWKLNSFLANLWNFSTVQKARFCLSPKRNARVVLNSVEQCSGFPRKFFCRWTYFSGNLLTFPILELTFPVRNFFRNLLFRYLNILFRCDEHDERFCRTWWTDDEHDEQFGWTWNSAWWAWVISDGRAWVISLDALNYRISVSRQSELSLLRKYQNPNEELQSQSCQQFPLQWDFKDGCATVQFSNEQKGGTVLSAILSNEQKIE